MNGTAPRYHRLESTIYAHQEMQQMCALVVGMGAVGNEVVKHLALIGVGRLLLMDFDLFEVHNLTRSVLFAAADRDQVRRCPAKVDLACDVVRRWNPDVQAEPLPLRVEQADLGPFLEADVVFSCVDTLAARVFVAVQAARAATPLVEGGMAPDDPERFEVVATDPVNGPCGAICLHEPLREKARTEILPNEFYAHEGCSVISRNLGDGASVPTLSMTSSVVAAEQVVLGLQLVRERQRKRPRLARLARGTRIRMTLRASGEQRLAHDYFASCDSGQCPLELARGAGRMALVARHIPPVSLNLSRKRATLVDILRCGAKALDLPPESVEVWVDQGYTPGYECETCGKETDQAVLLHVAHAAGGCCETPSIAAFGHRVTFDLNEAEMVGPLVAQTTVDAMGYRQKPGWIVRALGDDPLRPSVRVILAPPEPTVAENAEQVE